ncbi:MAG: YfiR family protein [Candidatus Hydrogenedentota bacterium]
MTPISTYSGKLATLLALSLCAITPPVQSQQDVDPFIKLTVALIYRSSMFVTWPKNAFDSEESPFVIGVLGNDSLHDELLKSTEVRDINGHPINLISLDDMDNLSGVHVLCIDGDKLSDFLEFDPDERENLPILTVSDSSKFVHDGGILRIFLKNSKPKLEINVDAAKRQRSKISSQLLKFCDVIRDN